MTVKRRQHRVISFLKNVSIFLISSLIFFLLLELIAFRFIFRASDSPKLEFVNGIIKYQPNQDGIFRVKNEVKSHFRINSNGWNSGHKSYELETTKYRIAIIGDSYVEAFSVNYYESLAECLESKLGQEAYQVYRFGISGAPMSQYLHMLREEVIKYSPDLVIIVLLHNDFAESYRFKQGVYVSSFLKLNIENNEIIEEIEPTPFHQPWYGWLRQTATWRYLAYRQKIRFGFLRNIIFGNKERANTYQANIAVSNLSEEIGNNEKIAEYIFMNIKKICEQNDSKLIIVMDGDRNSIYNGIKSFNLYKTGALRLNLLSHDIAQKHGIHFIDLHPIFESHFARDHKPFNYRSDGHWNVYAHNLVAAELYGYIKNQLEIQQNHGTVSFNALGGEQ
jgi:lysophospholipase L1-like esterase